MRWSPPWLKSRSAVLGILFCALLGSIPAPARAFEDAEVRAMITHEIPLSEFAGADGIWLGRDRMVRIDGAGSQEIEEHLVALVLDPAWGDRTFRPYRRFYWSDRCVLRIQQARIWRSVTDSEPLPANAGIDSLAPGTGAAIYSAYFRERRLLFPALSKGDRVEIRLSWTLPVDRRDLNLNWFAETFGSEEPVIEQRLTLIRPHAAEISNRLLGPPLMRSSFAEGGLRRQVWLTGNLGGRPPALFDAPLGRLPRGADTLDAGWSQVLFTTVGAWEDLSAHYGVAWEAAWQTRTGAMDDLARELTTRVEDPRERALREEEYVQKEIRTIPVPTSLLSLRPLDAGNVARDRAGSPRDKCCLLVSLLRMTGIQAYPVLVRTRGGAWAQDYPCPTQLDRHVVLASPRGGEELWLDPVGGEVLPAGVGLIFHGETEGPAQGGRGGLIPFPGIAPRTEASR